MKSLGNSQIYEISLASGVEDGQNAGRMMLHVWQLRGMLGSLEIEINLQN